MRLLGQIWRGRLGWLRLVILLAVLTLTGIGVATIRATAGAGFAERQLMLLGVALAGFAVMNLVPFHALGRYSYLLFGLSLVLLIVVLVGKYTGWAALVPPVRGSCRWVNLIPVKSDSALVQAARVQPSELAKLAYVLALAWYMRYRRNYRTVWGLVGPFVLTLVPMALILLEPDLGTVLLFLPTLFGVLFMAGARVKHLAVILVLAILAAPVFYFTMMRGYQRERVQVLLKQGTGDPHWLRGPGYQLHLSKICIGSGQVHGHGREMSAFVQTKRPPDRHNDFIFAMIAHQGGFVGAAAVLGLYLVALGGGLVIAAKQSEPFGRLAAVGIVAMLAVQMVVNVGMTMGLAPVTGMTLPFVSYGGSSLIASYLALGLLLNVGRFRPYRIANKAFEFND